jgi:ABC-type transport system involved in cytochrome bd biosynthesis fused ATPase/permease subunit
LLLGALSLTLVVLLAVLLAALLLIVLWLACRQQLQTKCKLRLRQTVFCHSTAEQPPSLQVWKAEKQARRAQREGVASEGDTTATGPSKEHH